MDPATPTVRRSFSLPPPKSSSPDPQIEVLFNLPYVRIVAFTTSIPTLRPSSSNGSPIVEDEAGTLSWVSRFERTIAVGPLRIYRAPGSVAFLSCANALQPILPKSQCWCVDGDSKFVLQIRRPQYWRIEVPNKDEGEKERVAELKEVLSKVLRFEKTPCPFQRDFVVALPELSQTPIKIRPWRPVQGPQPYTAPPIEGRRLTTRVSYPSLIGSPAQSPASSHRIRPQSLERSPTPSQSPSPSSHNITTMQPQLPLHIQSSPPHSPTNAKEPSPEQFMSKETEEDFLTYALAPPLLESSQATSISRNIFGGGNEGDEDENEEKDEFGDATDDTDSINVTLRSRFQPSFQPLVPDAEEVNRPHAMKNPVRSTTAPPLLSLITSPPSKHRNKSPPGISTSAEADSSLSSSAESFHSMHSWRSPSSSPSLEDLALSSTISAYPYPHQNIALPKRIHTRDLSETNSPPKTPGAWPSPVFEDGKYTSTPISPPLKTPTLVGDISDRSDEDVDAVTPPIVRSSIRHRATTSSNSQRRELSPLPAAVNLFSPPRRSRSRQLQTARHLPTTIIKKTYEILSSPPSHLLHIMMNIATKIAAGEWRGILLSGFGEVSWDFEAEYAGDAWAEDDYGFALHPSDTRRELTSKPNNSNDSGGSCEVD